MTGALIDEPVLAGLVAPARRETLIAVADSARGGGFRLDFRLQGDRETVFFDV